MNDYYICHLYSGKKTIMDIKLFKILVILLVILVMRIAYNNINLNDFHSLCYFKMYLQNV